MDSGRLSRRTVLRSTATGAVTGGALSQLTPVRAQEPDTDGLRFLFWNTWLLDPVELFGWHADPKPQMAARATEIGEACDAVGYDIVGLCEVFEEPERERILDGFDGPVESRFGPRGDWLTHSGGAQTIVPNADFEIVRMGTHRYEESGLRQCDADAWAAKGVLYTEIDVGPGRIDLYTTHLFAGGGMPGCDGAGMDRTTVRGAQIEELTAFVEATSRPENVTVVAGDFNTTASRPAYEATLEPMMDQLGLYDAWVRHGDGRHGATNDAAFGGGCEIDTDDGLPYPCRGPAEGAGRRIDYVFIEEATPDHAIDLTVDQMNRVTFWRENGDPDSFFAEPGVPAYMGDHMGLDLSIGVDPTDVEEPTESGPAITDDDGLPLGLGIVGGAAVGILGAASAGVHRHRSREPSEPDRAATDSLEYPLSALRPILALTLLSLLLVPSVLVGGYAYRVARAAGRGERRAPDLDNWRVLARDGLRAIGVHLPVLVLAMAVLGGLSAIGQLEGPTIALTLLGAGYLKGAVTTAWLQTGAVLGPYRGGRFLSVARRREYATSFLTLVALAVVIAAVIGALAVVVVGLLLLGVALTSGLHLDATLETGLVGLLALVPAVVAAAIYATLVSATTWGTLARMLET